MKGEPEELRGGVDPHGRMAGTLGNSPSSPPRDPGQARAWCCSTQNNGKALASSPRQLRFPRGRERSSTWMGWATATRMGNEKPQHRRHRCRGGHMSQPFSAFALPGRRHEGAMLHGRSTQPGVADSDASSSSACCAGEAPTNFRSKSRRPSTRREAVLPAHLQQPRHARSTIGDQE